MRVLLATYNYYPYNFGGSEVYVSALAAYLQSLGHETVIVAATPEEAFYEHPVIFESEQLKICSYDHEGINVWGVKYQYLSLPHIYEKKSPTHQSAWHSFFSMQESFDVLHINGFTATIGLDLLKASKVRNPNTKVLTSYHTAISCAKGSLLYANKHNECYIKAETGTCTACIISEKMNLPMGLSRIATNFLPNSANEKSSIAWRLKNLVGRSVESFLELDLHTDRWIVYSAGIKKVLEKNDIDSNKIQQLRHGISTNFIDRLNGERDSSQVNFLYSGRLDKIKGFHTLIKAWLNLPENEGRKLWITAHPDSDNEYIKKLIQKALKRKDISFIGPLNQSGLIKLYKKVHCVIIPSECFEIGPLVFHEAIALGCNVISSDIGGCRELGEIYNNESMFFKCGDVQSLKELINNYTFSTTDGKKVLSIEEHNKSILNEYNRILGK